MVCPGKRHSPDKHFLSQQEKFIRAQNPGWQSMIWTLCDASLAGRVLQNFMCIFLCGPEHQLPLSRLFVQIFQESLCFVCLFTCCFALHINRIYLHLFGGAPLYLGNPHSARNMGQHHSLPDTLAFGSLFPAGLSSLRQRENSAKCNTYPPPVLFL